MKRELKIVKSYRVPGAEYVAVHCDDDEFYCLAAAKRLLQRQPDLGLGVEGLTETEAVRRVSCFTDLVDRGVDWVQTVTASGGELTAALSNGRRVPLGSVSLRWAAVFEGPRSPLLRLTRAQSEEMIGAAVTGAPTAVALTRPPCAAFDRVHP